MRSLCFQDFDNLLPRYDSFSDFNYNPNEIDDNHLKENNNNHYGISRNKTEANKALLNVSINKGINDYQ